jgi:hypothetical protein
MEKDKLLLELGENVKGPRVGPNLFQTELANRIGKDRASVNRPGKMQGKSGLPVFS